MVSFAKDGYGSTPAAWKYLGPLIHDEAYPPYARDGLPVYVTLTNAAMKKKSQKCEGCSESIKARPANGRCARIEEMKLTRVARGFIFDAGHPKDRSMAHRRFGLPLFASTLVAGNRSCTRR